MGSYHDQKVSFDVFHCPNQLKELCRNIKKILGYEMENKAYYTKHTALLVLSKPINLSEMRE